MCGCSKDCLILIPFRLPQISCFTLSLKCFSSVSENCPSVGIRPLLQFLHPLRAGPVLLTLPFLPLATSSYQVFGGSIYSFPLVRYSCPEFCMHFYVWRCIPECIHGERCTPHPPTPPPSCSPQDEDFKSALDLLMKRWIFKKLFLCRNGRQSLTGEDWGTNRWWRSRNLFWKKVTLWGRKTK